MNNIFDIKRFGKLYTKELKEYYHKYGPSTLSLLGCYLGFWIITLLLSRTSLGIESRDSLFTVIILVYICTLPIKLYGDINNKKLGVNYALLPASTTEKYTAMMVNSVIVYPAVFTMLMLILDSVLVFCSGTRGFSGYMLSAGFIKSNFSSYVDFILLQSAFLYGALLFKTHKLSKTFASLIGINVLIVILVSLAAFMFFKGETMGMDMIDINHGSFNFELDQIMDEKKQTLLVNLLKIGKYIYTIGFPVTLWILSFFRIKNMQYK